MKNQIELQQEILRVQSQIREMRKNLKNLKDYLRYLKEFFEDETEKEEDEEVERNEFGDEFVGGCATCGEDTNSSDINGNCKNCR